MSLFCKIQGIDIPLVSVGTSTFIGAGQFGKNARNYRTRFLNNPDEILGILEACYLIGGRGIEVVPAGKIPIAVKLFSETHDDFVVTGSTFPGPDPLIDELVEINAQIIFVHASVSDQKSERLTQLLEVVSSRGVIPGIAVHNPVSTLNYAFQNLPEIKTFLVPFNAKGIFMGNQKEVENLVDSHLDCAFMGMKTLGAGKIDPEIAYTYISKHNVCCAAIGMVNLEEVNITTNFALDGLKKRG
ncbi:MAG: hypothetical protein P8Y23_16260 [Candidatus Lokiarchaeota archaeon]